MNLPKFVYDDVPLFLGLISDLFPGLKCHRVTYPEFGKAIDDEIRKQSYTPIENQVIENKIYFKMYVCYNIVLVYDTQRNPVPTCSI